MPAPVFMEVPVAAPAALLWDLITDIEHAPQAISGITAVERLDGGSGFGVGTRWRETRTMFGRTATEEMTVSAVEIGRSYRTTAHNRGMTYTSQLAVAPVDETSSRLSMTFDATADGLLNRTLGAAVGRLMRSSVEKAMRQDLLDIAHAAAARHRAG